MSAIICGMDLWGFIHISPISASDANIITTSIIWEMFNTSPLFLGISSFPDKKQFPPTWLLTLGLLRYNASLWHASIMSLAWYVTITSWCEAASFRSFFIFIHYCIHYICLLWYYGYECYQNFAIHSFCIMKERSCHFLEKISILIQIWRLIFWFHVLMPCAIICWYMLVGLIFWFYWCFVMETLHCSFYIPCHGNLDFLSFIVPIKCYPTVSFTFPVFRYLIAFFECIYEAVGILFVLVYHSKIVKYQGEKYLPPFVFPWFFCVGIWYLIIKDTSLCIYEAFL